MLLRPEKEANADAAGVGGGGGQGWSVRGWRGGEEPYGIKGERMWGQMRCAEGVLVCRAGVESKHCSGIETVGL